MYLKSLKLEHDHELIHRVLGMTDYARTISRERIIFIAINRSLQVHDLFEDIEDAPAELRTVTADLQAVLQEIVNPLEYEFSLLHFFNYHRMGLQAASMYRLMNKIKDEENSGDDDDPMDTIKHAILKAVMKLRDRQDDDHGDDLNDGEESLKIDQLNNSALMKRVEFVKNSQNNFDKYMSLLNKWADNSADTSFSDDIIKNL